jgi:hypothetical protein
VQHPFQLYQQRNRFCSCDLLARNDDGGKKKDILPLFVSVNVMFSMQYEHASFPCMLQPETIP